MKNRLSGAMVFVVAGVLVLSGTGAATAHQPSTDGPVATSATRTFAGPATAKKFKNCAAMHRKYKGGVAKSSKAKNTKTVRGKKVVAKSKYKAKVSAALYKANKGLDRDKDGIACER